MSTSSAQKKPVISDWHPADILAGLHKKGWSLQQLALDNGYKGRSALSKALAEPYPKAEAIIAKELGVEPQEIWPSRYNADGTSNRTRGMKPRRPAHIRIVPKATTGTRGGNAQNQSGR